MKRDFGYLALIALLTAGAVRGQQGSLPRVYTANVATSGVSGSAPPPQGAYRTEFPEGGWVVANKRSGRYHYGKTTEILFMTAAAAEAAGYKLTAPATRR